MEKRLEKLEEKVDMIMDNHLPHINENVGDVKIVMEAMRTDVSWIKQFFWIGISSSVGSLLAALGSLIFK